MPGAHHPFLQFHELGLEADHLAKVGLAVFLVLVTQTVSCRRGEQVVVMVFELEFVFLVVAVAQIAVNMLDALFVWRVHARSFTTED